MLIDDEHFTHNTSTATGSRNNFSITSTVIFLLLYQIHEKGSQALLLERSPQEFNLLWVYVAERYP